MAQAKIDRALKHSVPPCTKDVISIGDNVLIWREELIGNRIGEWLGPYSVVKTDYKGKLIWTCDHDRPFSTAQVKTYLRPGECTDSFMTSVFERLKIHSSPGLFDDIFLTEVLHPTDPRANTPEMTNAKKAEIKNLLRRGTFKVILKKMFLMTQTYYQDVLF